MWPFPLWGGAVFLPQRQGPLRRDLQVRNGTKMGTRCGLLENGNQLSFFCYKMVVFVGTSTVQTSQESTLQTFALRDLRIGRCWEESDDLSFWKSFEWHREICFVTRWFSLIFHHYLQLSVCVESYFVPFSFGSNLFFKNLLFLLSIFHFVCQVCQHCRVFVWVFVMKTGKLALTWGMIAKLKMKHNPQKQIHKTDPLSCWWEPVSDPFNSHTYQSIIDWSLT